MHFRNAFRLLMVLPGALFGCGCSAASTANDLAVGIAPLPRRTDPIALESVLIDDVPHVHQKPDFCGEAVVESWLHALGSKVSQDQVFDLSEMEPARGMGATTRELELALRKLGFDLGSVFLQIAANSSTELDEQFAALHADLRQRIPSIVCTRFDERPNTTEHFRLVLGYDARTDEVIYHEPAFLNAAYQRMSKAKFMSLWPLKYDANRWTVIRLRLAGTPKEPPFVSKGITPAQYAQHIRTLRENGARGYHVLLERPFVVIGEGHLTEVQAQATNTVRWAVSRLKRDFFSRDPQRILDVWLLANDRSYRAKATALIGQAPSTPFGFYSSERDALIMNRATGGGTLVHEIVHPYIEANFPACPAWFNEGLGSLFEQSADRDGHIVGLTNWRLLGLKKRIRKGTLPSFDDLLATTRTQFYERDSGSNYAQSRYLLYYLQERGLLVAYYREFVENQATDPTGAVTLKRSLGISEFGPFQRTWEKWVLSLEFDGG